MSKGPQHQIPPGEVLCFAAAELSTNSSADLRLYLFNLDQVRHLGVKVHLLARRGDRDDQGVAARVSEALLPYVRLPPPPHRVNRDQVVPGQIDCVAAPEIAMKRASLDRLGSEQPAIGFFLGRRSVLIL